MKERTVGEPPRWLKVVSIITAIVIFVIVSLGALLFSFVDFVTGNIIGALVPLGIVGYVIFVIIRRGLEMRRLATEGVETTGTVTQKVFFSRGRCQIKYTYHDSFGRDYHRASLVSREIYDGLEVGSPVKVVYLPSRPSVSGLLSDVEHVRRGLGSKS
ncbi:MAG: hypothetical protein KatS3mg053_1783 [Candidatus Roseilinea sp.]|nr:MAG: hypothetical protein KatS3mg053_1783 [Candidatus Roseilinea sp.]